MGHKDRHKDPMRPRVFGIGLNKTGTTSFHEAMELLGFESLHWGGPPIRMKVEEAIAAGEPLLTHLPARFDVFSDIEVLSRRFDVLDRQYPGSKFVHTFRPRDAWVDSRRRHVERNLERRAKGEYDGNFLVVDEDKWRALWDRHVGRVREYFAGRDDFLDIDITTGPGWEPFCRLLGIEEPSVAFPWSNRDRRKAAG